ncbi:MAG TPA: cytochrome P450 [Ramlibacter sp.]|jgi:cytochrome P450|nr:cytochrome P450 [Ramlibacter sp.]
MDAAVASPLRIADLPGPPRLPVLGNAHQIQLPHFHEKLEAWRREYGDVFRVKVWDRQFVVMGDPQVAAEALRDRPGTFGRTDRVVRASAEMHFAGLFSVNGDKWRRQRPMVMAAFDPGHVRRYFPALANVARRLAARWSQAAAQGKPIPLQHDLMRYTVDVICGLAFGRDIDTLGSDEEVLQKHMEHIFPMFFQRIFAPVPYWRWFKLPVDRKLDADLRVFRDAVQGFIAAARERMQADPALREAPGNLIEAMIAARDRPGNDLDDEDVAANVATMLLAGEDTTANTLAWMVHLLSRHPQALARARDEVRAALGSDRVPSRLEQLDAMPFVEACAHETMRLKPVAPIMPQQASRDTVLAGVAIPAGTICIFLMRAGATDARHFSEPEAFRPERWLGDDAGPGKRISMPFGAGPRICPGRYLALLEIKMAMATLLGSFDIASVTPVEGSEVQERLAFTMTPTAMAMRLQERRD